jgi:hypothetical protein
MQCEVCFVSVVPRAPEDAFRELVVSGREHARVSWPVIRCRTLVLSDSGCHHLPLFRLSCAYWDGWATSV